MSAKRKPDEPEEVYVLKTEISSKSKTKSVRLEIPDFMEKINEMEDDEEWLSIGKLNVDGNDFGISVLRVQRPYESIIRVYVENMNDFDATVSIKLAGVEKSVELEGFEESHFSFDFENCMTWAEENGNVLNLDVKITQKPGQKTVWKR